MGCLPLANRPIVAHQVKYLETNGIFNIYIVVHRDAASKTVKIFREHYEAHPCSKIFVVVVSEEDTESTNALKMMCQLQAAQASMGNLPEYEQEVYRKKG